MSPREVRRPKVVVCGTKFGQVYLNALRRHSTAYELVGVLARGSKRSQACADHCEVPLYDDVDALPDDVDIACVVVRSGLLGGAGCELAIQLMRRGIHVLQEHPLHHDELAECLRTAHQNGVVYRLNSFYVNLLPVRRYLAAVHELLDRQEPLYVDASCGFQVAYALLDILGHALGGLRPWDIGPAAGGSQARVAPFRTVVGVLRGTPLTLRVQNELDPEDPDNYAHLLHRVCVGTSGGNLTLVETHGPIVWTPRPSFPTSVREPDAEPYFASVPTESLSPGSQVIGPSTVADYHRIFGTMWSGGVRRALSSLWATRSDPKQVYADGQYHLGLSRLWRDVTTALGPPVLRSNEEARPLAQSALDAMSAAAAFAERADPDDLVGADGR